MSRLTLLNRGQRVVLLVATALALVALVRFGIHQGSSTEVIPQETVSLPTSDPAMGAAVGSALIVNQPMSDGEQALIVIGAALAWLLVAVVVMKQRDGEPTPDGDQA